MQFNPDVLYTKSNEWVKNLGNFVRVGIDDYSQSSLGDIVHIELPANGTIVKFGIAFGSLEATKSVSDINAPVSGVISKVNNEVIKNPGIVNFDPFGEGWLVEIEPSDISELNNLMDSETYKKYILNEANSRNNS